MYKRQGCNNGLTDADLFSKLDFILDWAKQRRIRFVVTNGIRNVDHIPNRIANCASNRRRTALLTTYMAQRERADRLKVELVSLNDEFVRHWVKTVSYTHLDVYKRQLLRRA